MSSSLRRHALVAAGLIVSLTSAPRPAAAQATWARTFGGRAGGEFVHAVGEMAGGDLVVAASTDSFGTMTGDGWLIRLDAGGHVLSEHVVGQPLPGGVDGAVVLADGGAVFASRNVRDIFTIHDAVIVRVAADGTPAWVTQISAGNGRFFLNDIVAVSDGSFLGVGQASLSDAGPFEGWLVRFSATGSVLWQQQFSGGLAGAAMSFDAGVETADGGFVVTGWATGGAGSADMLVVKTTEAGAISWTRRLGGVDDDAGTAIVEIRGGGGYAVAGYTNSFTTSGHAGWVVRLDATGAILWTEAMGDGEWSDLQAITPTADQDLVVLGRLSSATNDLWAAKIDPRTATVVWQRKYVGDSGDYAGEIAELAGGDLLLAGTWGWGFPEEDLWLLRTHASGEFFTCGLSSRTNLTNSSPLVTQSAPALSPSPPFGTVSAASVMTDTSALTVATQCESFECRTLFCDALTVDPDPTCGGELQAFTLVTSGGTAPVTVTWDLDGDTIPETPGNPVVGVLGPGTTTVTAFATDACLPPQSCFLLRDVTVLPSAPPGEVSDVRGGALPLLVLDHGARLSFEDRADAVAYNLYADAIGSWYAPNTASGSACFIATTPAGAGRVEASPSLAADSWLVVTASNGCAEGGAGRDSFGTERMSVGAWAACGAAP